MFKGVYQGKDKLNNAYFITQLNEKVRAPYEPYENYKRGLALHEE
jgi:hypothetical protein